MKKDYKRKLIALLSSSVVLLSAVKSLNKDDKEIVYNEDYFYACSDPFACYKDEKIYIGNEFIINRIRDDSTKDIYIIDNRYGKDPNIRVCNSYEVIKLNDISNIIQIIMEYENKYPSKWDRSYSSMRAEWITHNLCYYLDFEKNRTGEVDLNNEDEIKYLSLINKK